MPHIRSASAVNAARTIRPPTFPGRVASAGFRRIVARGSACCRSRHLSASGLNQTEMLAEINTRCDVGQELPPCFLRRSRLWDPNGELALQVQANTPCRRDRDLQSGALQGCRSEGRDGVGDSRRHCETDWTMKQAASLTVSTAVASGEPGGARDPRQWRQNPSVSMLTGIDRGRGPSRAPSGSS